MVPVVIWYNLCIMYPDPDPRELEVDRVFHLPSLPDQQVQFGRKTNRKKPRISELYTARPQKHPTYDTKYIRKRYMLSLRYDCETLLPSEAATRLRRSCW